MTPKIDEDRNCVECGGWFHAEFTSMIHCPKCWKIRKDHFEGKHEKSS